MEHEIDRRIGAAAAVMRSLSLSVCRVEERTLGHDRKNKIPDTSG